MARVLPKGAKETAEPPWSGRNGSDGNDGEKLPLSTAQLGLWLFLGAVTMLFAGFSSAYLVHRGAPTWQLIPMPKILWVNTALLLLSSATLERARAALLVGRRLLLRWLSITSIIGLLFLAGQLLAWRQLAGLGVYLPSNPNSSFFYILTGAHGLHLAGGIAALFYLLCRARKSYGPGLGSTFKLCAVYWHFLDGLWLYLFILFFAI